MTLAIVYFKDGTSVHVFEKDVTVSSKTTAFEFIAGLSRVSDSPIESIWYNPSLRD